MALGTHYATFYAGSRLPCYLEIFLGHTICGQLHCQQYALISL